MYREVNVELARKGMTKKGLAQKIGMRYQTLLGKLSGKYPITYDECLEIKKGLESDLTLEELFAV